MPEPVKIITTDEHIDAAIRDAHLFEKYDRRVARAVYADGTDSIVLHLEDGVTQSIPRRLIQGLSGAKAETLRNIELLGHGTGLYWPELDVAHHVSGLLSGIYGSAAWMERLRSESKSSRISA
jgi:Protein of unknown function (DUF2442)